jgi:hypothetical protein
MTRCILFGLAFCTLLAAADKRPVQGHGDDDSALIEATIWTPEQVQDAVGSDFNGQYTVVNVRISPKGGKPFDVRLDNFILRSQSNGDHSGPMLAEQIAGSDAMVVQRQYGARSNPEMPAMLNGMKVEMKDQGKGGNLELLKKKILVEQVSAEPQTGLLFFPLSKEKPKSLVLSCTTPAGKLRIEFR